MGERIRVIKRMEEPKEYKIEKDMKILQERLSDKKIAIEKGIDILDALEKAEALDAVHAAIVQRKVITGNIVTELNKEQYEGILDNIGNVLFMFGDLDLEEASVFVKKINNGMRVANRANSNNKTSVKDLLGALKDPEINSSITMLLNFLKGMSREE
ncbi:hypothetical protein AXY37_05810 [Mammaliicoccus lentus]|jgi:uncharacterized protein YjgD (DUF1641 family)|uniref:DUF1641 domain-containing protein n=2 Tax=Mammaliicoccus TaxID=2803850 RepID=A0AAX3W3D8_MAMLE|nr:MULTISPECIES: DUF1641 domain-containing protein [Mammaliicoccus]MBF0748293.1 DUF1641 domain-containing protein [Mammaliicoccus lentus]MBF0794064.1 DUF1641 domain-containing protein [Mammaliicoccus lentus]MBW0762362.1 DUF1641 domain-containing protein [Mammaliicoccus lentus]MBW0768691.1 DUF1641 domain-containing protein [Mammaliicoccus lentus]MBW0769565.1 DUF1641 domain-containing protein [Mammaliicoccus lentus]